MYRDNKISVVVPAYNEERLIGRVIETMPEYVDSVIVIDDASQDTTGKIVGDYQKKNPTRIVFIKHEINKGVGGAISSGYKWSRDNDIDIAVVVAGDAQMNPDEMTSLIDPIVDGKVDYSKGNRLYTGDAWNKIPRVRYLGNSALSFLTKIASGYWHIADSQCGYTALNKKALQTIDWDMMYPRYGQPNDLLTRLNIYNFRVCDVPVSPIYNIGEKSGIKPIRMIPKFSILIASLFFKRMTQKYIIRDFHPLVFFYLSGFFFLLLALVFLIRFFVKYISLGTVPDATLLILIFCTFSFNLFFLFAMQSDMQYNSHLKGDSLP
jgi:glycosyltransferase involved in cell wall biosynthesis